MPTSAMQAFSELGDRLLATATAIRGWLGHLCVLLALGWLLRPWSGLAVAAAVSLVFLVRRWSSRCSPPGVA